MHDLLRRLGDLSGAEIADRVAEELAAWLGGTEHVVTLEPRTALAFERSELVRDESAARVAALAEWGREGSPARILVASLQALFQRTLAPDDIPAEPLRLAVRARLAMDRVVGALVELGYGHCRLAAAVPNQSPIEKVDEFSGLRVATAHPHATGRFFADRSIDVDIIELRGSVEVATKIGVADAIVDLISTGSTMRVNGLRPVGTLIESQAVLISRSDNRFSPEVQQVATAIRAESWLPVPWRRGPASSA